jgi:hypothetical protein
LTPTDDQVPPPEPSDWAVEDEQLCRHIGVDVVAADERQHLLARDSLHGRAEIGLHRRLEQVADVVDRVDMVAPGDGRSACVSTSFISVNRTFP